MTPRFCSILVYLTGYKHVGCHQGFGCFIFQGAVLIKSLAAKEPSALGLDTYYKQYYLCLAASAATIKWYFHEIGILKSCISL